MNDTVRQMGEGDTVFGVKDTVIISSYAYARTPEAYAAARAALEANGYAIPDHAVKSALENPEQDYEFFSLADENLRQGQCGSCNSLISVYGIAAHGHKCESCGEPTSLKYIKGGVIRFTFINDRKYIGNNITFRIFDYRMHEGKDNELVLYASPLLGDYRDPQERFYVSRGLFNVSSEEEAQNVLEEAKGAYRRGTEIDRETGEEVPVIILKDPQPGMIVEGSTFNTSERWGDVRNYSVVKVFKGKVYSEFDRLPIPENIHLSSRYVDGRKHSLAEENIHEIIMSAAGQVSRADYYYQDGRPAFHPVAFERMSLFVRHFVDVPYAKWQKFLATAPQDGPGFIYALADWASAGSDGVKRYVRDEPNFGNALVGMSKLAAGGTLTDAEAVAMTDGFETPEAGIVEEGLQEGLGHKVRAAQRRIRRRGGLDLDM